jgi:hypothetical protein
VLGVISSSPGDLEPVFASMLRNAVGICDYRNGDVIMPVAANDGGRQIQIANLLGLNAFGS